MPCGKEAKRRRPLLSASERHGSRIQQSGGSHRLEGSSVGCMNLQHVEREDQQLIGAMQKRPLKPPK